MKTITRQKDVGRPFTDGTALYKEIERFGGEQQVTVTQKALKDLEAAIEKNVAGAPDAFGANAKAESQRAAVARIMERMSANYLGNLASDLRKRSGYLRILGQWIHRSVITFLVYALMAAISISIFIPKVLSPFHGDFIKGIIGLLVVIGGGIAILIRVRK